MTLSEVVNDSISISKKSYFFISGEGELTFTNGDYFKGDFLGCLGNRSGVLTRLSQGDAFTFGTWKNGKLEVSLYI